MKSLDGKKVYIVSFLIATFAISGYLLGYHDLDKMIELLLTAGTIAGFRDALRKIIQTKKVTL